ncbi:MAG: hypothetical protein VYE68_10240 [Acidobacteriota bacterium]|nr:hypothetical protein [Acidobacteriota bacterium]
MRHASIVWLVTGVGTTLGGLALTMSASVEAGTALLLIGVGVLATGAIALLRPAGVRTDPFSEVDNLDQRIDKLRRLEARLHGAGVSASEQAYDELTFTKDADTPETRALDDTERRLGELIQTRCDHVWAGIREHRYVRREAGRVADLDGSAIFAEFRDVVQEVASLYHASSDNAVLEARTGDIALAVRSATGELLQIARQVPYVDPGGWSVQEVVKRLEQVEKGLTLYKKLSPYDHYITGAMLAARIAVGANPISLAAWTLGKEGAKRVGGRLLKSRAEAWLKELLEGSVALVYLRVARIYDPQRAYRGPEWTALVELLRIHARIPGIDYNRRALLDRILRAEIPDEFAKMALLRALAEDAEPDARSAPPMDLTSLRATERQTIATRVSAVLATLRGLNSPAASAAIDDLEQRLQWGLRVDLVTSGSGETTRVTTGITLLALVSRDWLGLDRDDARQRISDSPFGGEARTLLGRETDRAVLETVSAIFAEPKDTTPDRGLVEPPRELVGDHLAEPLTASLADLLTSTPDTFPVDHDHLMLLHASVLIPERKRVKALWKRYLEAASGQIKSRLELVDLASWPLPASPTILRCLDTGDRPLVIFEAKTATARRRWVLVLRDRVVVGTVTDDELAIADDPPDSLPMGSVRLVRRVQRLSDELIVCTREQRLTVSSGRSGSFDRRFGPLLESLGLNRDTLEREN